MVVAHGDVLPGDRCGLQWVPGFGSVVLRDVAEA
jgi:hypothetical protein